MPFLPAGARRETPWKNGGGSTTEIAVSPEGADFDAFDWRISMARVEQDGPFSAFPGIDRVLSVVEGELILEVEGAAPAPLDAASPPHAFPGDVGTFGRLVRGPVVDLNVMTRRGVSAARVARLEVNAAVEVTPKGAEWLLILLEGEVDLDGGGKLGAPDAWRGQGGVVRLAPRPSARALLVEFFAAS